MGETRGKTARVVGYYVGECISEVGFIKMVWTLVMVVVLLCTVHTSEREGVMD